MQPSKNVLTCIRNAINRDVHQPELKAFQDVHYFLASPIHQSARPIILPLVILHQNLLERDFQEEDIDLFGNVNYEPLKPYSELPAKI